jgi:formamidopyrimidine-DNA glycosylase
LIAGIGNMYADEALFAAKINPLRPADSLSQDEIKRLHYAIQKVLMDAIKSKGASVSTYFRPCGEMGRAHSHFKVAHQKGKLCPICGNSIKRIPICQRGSYYCPVCQPGKD